MFLFPFFSTDNGPHYHNSGFVLYLTEVNEAFDVTLVEYNNFEAGEGKSKLDKSKLEKQSCPVIRIL